MAIQGSGGGRSPARRRETEYGKAVRDIEDQIHRRLRLRDGQQPGSQEWDKHQKLIEGWSRELAKWEVAIPHLKKFDRDVASASSQLDDRRTAAAAAEGPPVVVGVVFAVLGLGALVLGRSVGWLVVAAVALLVVGAVTVVLLRQSLQTRRNAVAEQQNVVDDLRQAREAQVPPPSTLPRLP